MRIFIGADHAAFDLKQKVVPFLKSEGHDVVDLGTQSTESCDYPELAKPVAMKVRETPEALGLLICGSGIGMAIAANKVRGIRAAVVSDPKSAALAREHNDAQILCLGARVISEEQAMACVRAFIQAKFDSTHPRHRRRIDQIAEIEKEQCK